MPTTAATTLDRIATEAAPLIAAGLAGHPNPLLVHFAYTPYGVTVTAQQPERITDLAARLTPTFSAAGWGLTVRRGTDDALDSVQYLPPWSLCHAFVALATDDSCLYCLGPAPYPIRGCCSARCAHFEHDKD